MNWWYVLESVLVTWPPAAFALWLGRRKLHAVTAEQTRELIDVTNEQTALLRQEQPPEP